MTVAAIHQPQYLPYLGFFHKLARCDVFVVLDNVQFHRRGLQHRNKIKTKDGWQWLTVPVLQRFDQRINEVMIDPTAPWQRKHVNALRWNYGRAPFSEMYVPELIEILEKPWENLSELNMALTGYVMEKLGNRCRIVFASELDVEGRRSDLLAGLCRAVGATAYLSGPGGRRYMDLEVFETAGIDVMWQEFEHPQYEQLFPEAGFIPDLSVVDVLMSCGPNTSRFLEDR
jgi:hypothetical protein